VALDNEAPRAALRAYFNLSNLLYYRDDLGASAEYAREGLALARRLGERDWEWNSLADLVSVTFLQGEWDEALDLAAEIPHLEDFAATRFAAPELLLTLPQLHVARGEVEQAARTLEPFVEFENSADVQERASWEAARAAVFRAQGMYAEALVCGQEAFAIRSLLGATHAAVKAGWVEAAEAAFALGDDAGVKDLLQEVQEMRTGQVTPYLRAQATRLEGRRAMGRGEAEGAESGLKAAAGLFREIGMPFWLAVALLELGEWLQAQGRSEDAGPLLGEAQEIFERLKAGPWLERLGQLVPVATAGRG
jgi:tetratricopeptide (TPR) repeat protein